MAAVTTQSFSPSQKKTSLGLYHLGHFDLENLGLTTTEVLLVLPFGRYCPALHSDFFQ